MKNQEYVGFAIGATGLIIGLVFYPVMTMAVFLMMWGENIQRGHKYDFNDE